MNESINSFLEDMRPKAAQFAQQRMISPSNEPGQIDRIMSAVIQLENQVYNLFDEFQGRLERGGVLQDIAMPENNPSNLSPPSCRLANELIQRGMALENFSQRLKTLLERLAI